MKPQVLHKGKYTARLASAAADIRAAQRLRYRAFIDPAGTGLDADGFDDECQHVLIEEPGSGTLVGCFRVMGLKSGQEIGQSYAAQYYQLCALENYPGKMIEMGRFCIAPGLRDPEIVRLAWAMMTRIVDGEGFEMMFGCSSFPGVQTAPHLEAFSLLKQHYIAPKRWSPMIKAPEVFQFTKDLAKGSGKKPAMRALPPLLRTYLMMGGWVSDHAVIDRGLNTLHVFTGLEVKQVPVGRARVLRAVAG